MKINGINFSDDGIEEYSLLELKEMKLQRDGIQKMEVRNLRINVLHVIIEKKTSGNGLYMVKNIRFCLKMDIVMLLLVYKTILF